MKGPTPRWWYRREPPPLLARLALTPVARAWEAATHERIARTRPAPTAAPVICVGNVTLGGAGKTPVVRELLRRLRQAGTEAHGLARGYGGRLRGPVRVDPAVHSGADVGDEPLMLAGEFPMWIARDRAAGAQAAAAAGAEVVVMDDGHQNPSIAKALSLVVVDAETRDGEWPFGAGGVFPLGPMREPLRKGLARADAVVLLAPADLHAPDPQLIGLLKGCPVLHARLVAKGPPPAGPQVGFAGVGKPWKVERALRAAGCDLKAFESFPDHHPYSEMELESLSGRAAGLGAGLVTTEKDWIRLPAIWRARVAAWPVRAEFEDPVALDALLRRTLGRG